LGIPIPLLALQLHNQEITGSRLPKRPLGNSEVCAFGSVRFHDEFSLSLHIINVDPIEPTYMRLIIIAFSFHHVSFS